MNPSPTVAAVVVTFNRRELLEKVLDALEQQERPIDHLYVINNASTDDTREYLKERTFTRPTTVITSANNSGGAGGFTRGIEAAWQGGQDLIWLMDDDTVPHADALGELVDAWCGATELRGGAAPSFACSQVLWTDGTLCEMNTPETVWDWPRPLAQGKNWMDVKSCSFVSCMVSREAVEAVGYPYREYFIWFDDAEYTMRLAKWRPGIFVPSSQVDHLLPQNRGVNWGDVNEKNIWKFEYGMRNQLSAAWSLRQPELVLSLMRNVLGQARGAGVDKALRVKLLKAALKGLTFHPAKRFPEK